VAIKLIFSIFILVFLHSCGQDNHIRTYQLAKTKAPDSVPRVEASENKSTGFSWKKPESWIPSSGSSMRLASFDVPYSDGMGDLSVIQLGGTGGGFEANVNRWRRQLNLEPQSLSEIEKEMIENKGGMGLYNVIGIINEELGSAFLCAILPAGNQTLFVKLSANPKGVREIETEFISFCSSLIISI
jgi:hypothetical protein